MSNRPWWVFAAGMLLFPVGWLLAPKCPVCGEKHTNLARHTAFDHADLPVPD